MLIDSSHSTHLTQRIPPPPPPRSHPSMSCLQCVDYSAQPLPKGYDLVFSRDSLQHIPMHGAWQFLNNVRASGAKYLLVGSYATSAAPNTNIAAGGWGFDCLARRVQQCGEWALCGCAGILAGDCTPPPAAAQVHCETTQ